MKSLDEEIAVRTIAVAIVAVLAVCKLPGAANAEALTYTIAGVGTRVIEVTNGDVCFDVGQALHAHADALSDEHRLCLASEPVRAPVRVNPCGFDTVTVTPACTPMWAAVCKARDYARERVRACYTLAHKHIAEQVRRAQSEPADRPIDVGRGGASALNQGRRSGSAGEALSRRLTSLGIKKTSAEGRRALQVLESTLGEYSLDRPIPRPSELALPPSLRAALEAGASAAESQHVLGLGDTFASDPEVRSLMASLTGRAITGTIDWADGLSIEDLEAAVKVEMVAPDLSVEGKEPLTTGVDLSVREDELRSELQAALSGIEGSHRTRAAAIKKRQDAAAAEAAERAATAGGGGGASGRCALGSVTARVDAEMSAALKRAQAASGYGTQLTIVRDAYRRAIASVRSCRGTSGQVGSYISERERELAGLEAQARGLGLR